MCLAILMANTDESEFAARHPSDGQKFTDLIHLVRPDWTCEVFAVKDGIFPGNAARFDGVIITGSPASAQSEAPWVARLLGLIGELHSQRVPMFGACFGHQAIALALGGKVGNNPGGWFHGLSSNIITARPNWMRDLPDPLKLYASHKEQVTDLPENAVIVSRAAGCDVTGFAIANHVFTTQHHPEMTHDFITALTEELAEHLGAGLTAQALNCLRSRADTVSFVTAIAYFFEQAVPAVALPAEKIM